MSKKTVSLKCTSAFMARGEMITPGRTVHGVPEADARNLVRRGKARIVEDAPTEDETDVEAPALSELTVAELKAVAQEHEIEGADGMKKADLVAAIEAAEAEGDD